MRLKCFGSVHLEWNCIWSGSSNASRLGQFVCNIIGLQYCHHRHPTSECNLLFGRTGLLGILILVSVKTIYTTQFLNNMLIGLWPYRCVCMPSTLVCSCGANESSTASHHRPRLTWTTTTNS